MELAGEIWTGGWSSTADLVAPAAAAAAAVLLAAVSPALRQTAVRCWQLPVPLSLQLFWQVAVPLGRLRLQLLTLLRRGASEVLYIGEDGEVLRLREAPPKPAGTVRCVCISDTHLQHHQLRLPPGDLLLHGGDILLESRGADQASLAMIADFNDWLAEQPFLHKVVIAGNHDGALAKLGEDEAKRLLPSAVYLQDSAVEVQGLRIYGSPMSVGSSANAAFQTGGGYDEATATAAIPDGLDILLTHGPAGRGSMRGRASALLEDRIALARPRYHICGHLHTHFGVTRADCGTLLVNVSTADALFAVSHAPVVVDIRPVVPEQRLQ